MQKGTTIIIKNINNNISTTNTIEMNHIKYIIKDGLAIIFPIAIKHSEAAKTIMGVADTAGFFYTQINGLNIECFPFGESLSLGIKSNPQADKIILEKLLNQIGYKFI